MSGSSETQEIPEIELSSDELVEVEEERMTLVSAAANARSVAMLTGTHGVIAAPLSQAAVRLPKPRAFVPEGAAWTDKEGESKLVSLLRARVAAAEAGEDPVAKMRARLELAHARVAEGDAEGAHVDAVAAAAATSHAPSAHALLRVLAGRRDRKEEQLTHVEHLALHGDARARADYLAEKGRLVEAAKGPCEDSAAAFIEALSLAPDHAGAIYGLEAALDATQRWEDLAEHLGALAKLVEPPVAAWLHVERAILLDRRMSDVAGARAALDRAVSLAPEIGPVRDAAVDHAVLHRDDARLASLLESEAALERDGARAARLELDAALAHLRAGTEVARAVKLLERAHGRAPTTPLVDVRVASELARLLDAEGRHADVLRVRKSSLRAATDAGAGEELLHLRAIAAAAERAGELDDAVLALERARVLEGDDSTLLSELDRLLLGAGRHDARAVMWMRESARVDDGGKKARALLFAAEAARAAGRTADSAKYMQAAWIAAPGAPGVFDALAERLPPAGERGAVEARVAFYEQALRATEDPRRRLHYLEKIAWLWDDAAGDAEAACRAYEDVLQIDPTRASAIAGLASAAARAGDAKALGRALLAEAAITTVATARAEVRLRAAEALASAEPERALALAQELEDEDVVGARASDLVTRLHADGHRWELVARSLEGRRRVADSVSARTALALAEASVLSTHLSSPVRALETLEDARRDAPDEPSIVNAILDTLQTLGDVAKLESELEKLAERDAPPQVAAARLVLAAEIEERTPGEGHDVEAVRLYGKARSLVADDLIADRLRRLGARTEVDPVLASPLLRAVRALDMSMPAPGAEPLLASEDQRIATLRVAERLARRARSAPLLANALALAAAGTTGTMALRALSGLATLVTWALPESDDVEPWDKLLALGSKDAIVLDTLIHRARSGVRSGVPQIIDLAREATKRRGETAADDTERMLLRTELARLTRLRGDLAEASVLCQDALAIDPTSLAAALLLAELAAQRGDRPGAIAAATSLAKSTFDPRSRAELLRDAADLSAAEGDVARAASLLERALEADPDSVVVAARLAQLQATRGAWGELARALRRGLDAAKSPDAIVPMASELADVAKNRVSEPLMAIEALEKVRAIAPGHVPALFNLAELYIGERAWKKALEALSEVIARTTEASEKVTAHVGRASIYARIPQRQKEAEQELRAALALDATDVRAIRALLKLPSLEKEERAALLSRAVTADGSRDEKRHALLELAELRRELGDAAGAEGALVEAAAISPDAAMLSRLRVVSGTEPAALARVLGRAVSRARELGSHAGTDWLVALGEAELATDKAEEAVKHFEEAIRLDPTREASRFALARALAKRGRHETAAAALGPLLEAGARSFDAASVRLLEESLAGAGRTQQAHVARELRAVAGDLDKQGLAALGARRMMQASNSEALDARAIRSFVMPGGLGKHPIWEVAALTSGISGKLARIGLAEQGASTRDRVKPKAAHPLRQVFDRLGRVFEVFDVELAVSEHVAAPVVAAEDVPWVVVPSAMAEWPEPHVVAALARPFTRIALGVPWLGVLPPHEVLAVLVAVARQVAPGFAAKASGGVEPLVADYELRAKRAIDRKRRRSLEDLEPILSRASLPEDGAFVDAVLRAESRAAFLISGDLRATLDAIAIGDPRLADGIRVPGPAALATTMAHPLTRDVVSYALGGDATALRRSLGTLWI